MDAFLTGWLGEMSLGWAVLTFIWVVLLAYRAWLASREEEQMYLGSTPSPWELSGTKRDRKLS